MALPELGFKIPDLSSQFTGQELIDQYPKLEMMDTEGDPPELGGDGMLGDIAKGVSSIAGAFLPQEQVNAEFISRNKNLERGMFGASQITNTLSSIGLKSGNPLLAGLSAGLMVGEKVVGSSLDEFGVVKDKTKAILGGLANPISAINAFANQGQRKEAKTQFVNTKLSEKRAQNQVAGNRITNSIPKYTPPSYGRFGGKLGKFGNNGRS